MEINFEILEEKFEGEFEEENDLECASASQGAIRFEFFI